MKEPPVSRVNTLSMAKYFLESDIEVDGLCVAIKKALLYYGITVPSSNYLSIYFPKFKHIYALIFGGFGLIYWWKPGYTKGRVAFLNWLIRKYRNDNTNLNDIKIIKLKK